MDAGDDCREFSEKGEDNMLACSSNGSNISDISPEVSLSRWGKDQLGVCSTSETERQKIQPFQDMMVKLQICCSRYTFYLDGECMNTLKLNILSFRSLSCESTSDNLIERDEARLFNPDYIMFRQDIKVRGGGKGNTTLPIEPSLESPINCLGLKKQLDQSSSDFEPPLELHNSLSFSLNRADAYLWRSKEGFKAILSDTSILGNAFSSLCELFNTMATNMSLSFTEACGHILRNITGCESDLFKSLFSGSQLDFKTQSPSAIVAQTSASSLKGLDLNLLYLCLIKCTTSHCSNQKIIEISAVQNPDETVQTVDNRGTHLPSANVQQPEDCGSIMENHSALISYANDITEKLMQTPPAQSMSNNTIGIHTNDTITVSRQTWNLHSHPTADELKMMHCSSVPYKYSFKKKKKLLKPGTSSSAVNSKVGQQSEVPTLAVSRSLLMKFPKDFSLPSKEELVKKFSPFGMIDCLNTKVYFYAGSAQVVFLHQLDAMAAYQYAKRKKIAFGKADVKFWLDPLQDKRESKNLVSSRSCATELPGFNIRSCLKKSRVLEKEGKSSRKKVRFSMET